LNAQRAQLDKTEKDLARAKALLHLLPGQGEARANWSTDYRNHPAGYPRPGAFAPDYSAPGPVTTPQPRPNIAPAMPAAPAAQPIPSTAPPAPPGGAPPSVSISSGPPVVSAAPPAAPFTTGGPPGTPPANEPLLPSPANPPPQPAPAATPF
jgi:hypothetical protein